jgi:hypothetical protein
MSSMSAQLSVQTVAVHTASVAVIVGLLLCFVSIASLGVLGQNVHGLNTPTLVWKFFCERCGTIIPSSFRQHNFLRK